MTLPLKPGESPEAQAYAAQSVEEAEFQIMMCLAAGNHEAARRALKAFGDLRGEEERAKAMADAADLCESMDYDIDSGPGFVLDCAAIRIRALAPAPSAPVPLEKLLAEERAKALAEAALIAKRAHEDCFCVESDSPCAACMMAAHIEGAIRGTARRSLAAAPSGDAAAKVPDPGPNGDYMPPPGSEMERRGLERLREALFHEEDVEAAPSGDAKGTP